MHGYNSSINIGAHKITAAHCPVIENTRHGRQRIGLHGILANRAGWRLYGNIIHQYRNIESGGIATGVTAIGGTYGNACGVRACPLNLYTLGAGAGYNSTAAYRPVNGAGAVNRQTIF